MPCRALTFAAITMASIAGLVWGEGTWTSYELGKRVTAIAVSSQNDVWCGTEGGGCLLFNGLSRKTYTTADGLGGNLVNTVAIDISGAVWVGVYSNPEVPDANGGVSKFNGVSWTTYTTADGLGHNTVNSIAVDRHGTLWFATNAGLSRFDGESWKTYTTAEGLPGNVVSSVAAGSDGTIWCGTGDDKAGRGVAAFDGMTWKTYTTADGLANNLVTAIVADTRGSMWFGTPSGISRFDGEAWKTYSVPVSWIFALAVDNADGIWAGTPEGAWRFNGGAWRSYSVSDGLAGNYVVSIDVDSQGALWFGTMGGVSQYEENPVAVSDSPAPFSFGIRTASPNPFNPSTALEFTLDRAGKAAVSVYTVSGQHVETIADGMMGVGTHRVVWNAAGRASGVYFVTLESGGRRDVRKVTFMK